MRTVLIARNRLTGEEIHHWNSDEEIQHEISAFKETTHTRLRYIARNKLTGAELHRRDFEDDVLLELTQEPDAK